MKFQFRLEQALRLTTAKELAKKCEVGACQRRILILEQRLETCSDAIRDVLAKSRPESAHFDEAKICHERDQLGRIQRLVVDEKEQLVMLQHELKQSMSRRLALEKLKEKRFQEFRLERRRDDQQRLDEHWQLTNGKRP